MIKSFEIEIRIVVLWFQSDCNLSSADEALFVVCSSNISHISYNNNHNINPTYQHKM